MEFLSNNPFLAVACYGMLCHALPLTGVFLVGRWWAKNKIKVEKRGEV